MNAFSMVFDGSVTASFRFLERRNGYKLDELDLDLLHWSAHSVLDKEYPVLLKEWETAVDAIVSDEMLRQFVNAQCLELGDKIADKYHDEVLWSVFE